MRTPHNLGYTDLAALSRNREAKEHLSGHAQTLLARAATVLMWTLAGYLVVWAMIQQGGM